MFRKTIVGALAFTALLSSQALAWDVVEGWNDPINGRNYTVAAETNAGGFSIHIFRDTDKKVYVVYSIPTSSFDRMPTEGRVLAIRPDNNDVREVKATIVAGAFGDFTQSNGIDVRDKLWHGEGESPTKGTLRDILDSETLHARFYTDTGSFIETEWSLTGAPEAISSAIGISVAADPAAQAWDKQQTELLINATNRCGADGTCLGRILPCFDLLTDVTKVEVFNACVKTAAP